MTGGWETEISLSEETFDLVFESNGRYSKEGIRIKDAVMLLRSKSGSSSNETAFLLGTPVSEVVIIPIQYTIDENGKGKARLQLDSETSSQLVLQISQRIVDNWYSIKIVELP